MRDDEGLWNRIETCIKRHSDAELGHTVCPDCLGELYPELVDDPVFETALSTSDP